MENIYFGEELKAFLASYDRDILALISRLIKSETNRRNSDWSRFIMQMKDDGTMHFEHKDWVNSIMDVRGKTITANAGCRNLRHYGIPDTITAYNEFLSYRMPSHTYIIDGYMTIETDSLGRIKKTCAVFERDKVIWRDKRLGEYQSEIIEIQDGHLGQDDGGHQIQMGLGGPNELINQLPMNSQMNRYGIWRNIEDIELDECWKNGKTVTAYREPLYHGDEKRPYAIKVDVLIDGQHLNDESKGIKCPMTIDNPLN